VLPPTVETVGFRTTTCMKRYAELNQVKLDDNAIQYITDSMANSMPIQINYEGSGWRTVQPYSFTTSKDNNLLVMCYKQDGSVRSYRFDRINDLFVDDSLIQAETGATFEDSADNTHNNPSDFEIPYLPEYDEILEESENEPPEPFSDAIDTIDQGEMFEPVELDENNKPLSEKEKEKRDEERLENEEQEADDNLDFDLDNNENEEKFDDNLDFDLDNDNTDKNTDNNNSPVEENNTENNEPQFTSTDIGGNTNGEETLEPNEQPNTNQ